MKFAKELGDLHEQLLCDPKEEICILKTAKYKQ